MKSHNAFNGIPAASRPGHRKKAETEVTFYRFGSLSAPGKVCVIGCGANDQVFVPADVLPGNQGAAALTRATADGVMGCMHEGHFFLPADWVIRQLHDSPELAMVVRKMIAAARRARAMSVSR